MRFPTETHHGWKFIAFGPDGKIYLAVGIPIPATRPRAGLATVADAQDPAGVETGRVAREAWLLGPSLTGVLSRMERDGLITREKCPQDARRTVVRATAPGLDKVQALSQTIEAHYSWMEQQLGKAKLGQLYALLDEMIVLEAPETETPEEQAEEEER